MTCLILEIEEVMLSVLRRDSHEERHKDVRQVVTPVHHVFGVKHRNVNVEQGPAGPEKGVTQRRIQVLRY